MMIQSAAPHRVVYRALALMLVLAAAPAWPGALDFRAPVSITKNDGGLLAHMDRSSAGQLLWTGHSKVALSYWTGDEITTVSKPNEIMFREWSTSGGWSPPVKINHSLSPQGADLGGRHPAMVQRPNGSLFAVWHDSRHCTTALNMINNIEIYGNTRPAGGAFGASDTRLTQTTSGSNGDNGYLPKLANLPGGKMALAWYDFTWNVDKSEVVVKISDANGSFGSPALTGALATDASFRATGDEAAAFSAPAIAADSGGILHLVWASGTQGGPNSSNLYYGRIDPTAKTWLEKGRLASLAGGAADPVKIVSNPKSGDIWLVYTDYGTYNNEEIVLRRRARGAAAFEAPIRLTNNAGRQHYADLAVAPDGKVHCVYVDESDESVRYLVYDPVAKTATTTVRLTGAQTGTWLAPAVAVSPFGVVFAVWGNEEFSYGTGTATNELFFTTNYSDAAVGGGWDRYE